MNGVNAVLQAILPILAQYGVGEEALNQLLTSRDGIELKYECGKMTLLLHTKQESKHYPVTVRVNVPHFVLLLSAETATNGCKEEAKCLAEKLNQATNPSSRSHPWPPPIARFFVTLLASGRKTMLHKLPKD